MIQTATVLRVLDPSLLREEIANADVVLVEHPWQFPFIAARCPAETPLVYSSHNVETELHAGAGRTGVQSLVAHQVRTLERRAVTESDAVVTTTQRDRDTYADLFGLSCPTHVAPNGVFANDVVKTARYDHDAAAPVTVLFVGSDHPPNIKAVKHLSSIAEQLAIGSVDAEFEVVGTVCNAFDPDDIHSTVNLQGFVDDLDAYYAAADVAVNPITEGAGSNVKLAEYFARGLPVISTEFGTRGYDVVNGETVLISDVEETPKVLADETDDRFREVGQAAREYAKSELRWQTISARLRNELLSYYNL
jgi:glycosyltransferase involved in cell wall biosynthesis